MAYLGSWKIDDLLTFACNTHSAATGAATDADAVPAYRVYEDETGTAILTGNTAKLDDANTTGFYTEQITLSAANGFEKGKCYTVYISAAVATVTGTMHHNFQIEAEVDANAVSNIGSGVITATSINADAITAAKLHADVTTEIQSGLATAAALDAVDNFIDTEINAIKTQTDKLTFTVANQLDANIQSVNDVALTGDGDATPWGPA